MNFSTLNLSSPRQGDFLSSFRVVKIGCGILFFLVMSSTFLGAQACSPNIEIGILFEEQVYEGDNNGPVMVCAETVGSLVPLIDFTGDGLGGEDAVNCTGGLANFDITWGVGGASMESNCISVSTENGEEVYTLNISCTNEEMQDISIQFSLTINRNATPVIETDNCENGEIDLVLVDADQFEGDVNWFDSGMMSIINPRVEVPLPGQLATYFVEVEGCEQRGEIILDGNDFNTQFAISPNSPSACTDEIVELTAISANTSLTYSWSTGSGSGTVNVAPGTYTVTATSGSCSSSQSITVTEVEKPDTPSIQVADEVESLCPDETTTLTANTDEVGVSFSWTRNGGTLSGENGATLTAGPGTYTLVTERGGCASEPSTVTIDTLSAHNPAIIMTEPPYCVGTSVTLTADGEVPGTTIAWSTGSMEPSIEVLEGGTYTLTFSGGDRCPTTVETTIPPFDPVPEIPPLASVTVSTESVNLISLDLGDQAGIRIIEDSLKVLETVNATVVPNSLSLVGDNSLRFTAQSQSLDRATGAIRFLIVPESAQGCPGGARELLVRVVSEVEEPFIPEIISPNGDGSNDTWAIVFPENADEYDVTVYSRGGAVVFSGSGGQMPWDASQCPNGVYYYRISQRGAEGGQWQGALTIIGRDR